MYFFFYSRIQNPTQYSRDSYIYISFLMVLYDNAHQGLANLYVSFKWLLSAGIKFALCSFMLKIMPCIHFKDQLDTLSCPEYQGLFLNALLGRGACELGSERTFLFWFDHFLMMSLLFLPPFTLREIPFGSQAGPARGWGKWGAPFEAAARLGFRHVQAGTGRLSAHKFCIPGISLASPKPLFHAWALEHNLLLFYKVRSFSLLVYPPFLPPSLRPSYSCGYTYHLM